MVMESEGGAVRVEQLAATSGVSVDTIRFYQARGLLSPPRREGRVAYYGPEHVERLARIRSLQSRGLTLATIRRLVSGELDATDEELAAAVSSGVDREDEEFLTIEELAERSGIPLAMLQGIERE